MAADNNTLTPQNTPSLPQERTYYQKDSVLVTSHRVVFGGETHVLHNPEHVAQ